MLSSFICANAQCMLMYTISDYISDDWNIPGSVKISSVNTICGAILIHFHLPFIFLKKEKKRKERKSQDINSTHYFSINKKTLRLINCVVMLCLMTCKWNAVNTGKIVI